MDFRKLIREADPRVKFNWASAVFWLALGIASFPLGWYNLVVLVWIASVYANIKTDIGAAEAADDRKVLRAVSKAIAEVQKNRVQMDRIEDMLQKALASKEV
jgi:hypothetical protein